MNIQSKLSYMGNKIEIEGSLPVGCFDSGNLVGTLEVLWSSCEATFMCGKRHSLCNVSTASIVSKYCV